MDCILHKWKKKHHPRAGEDPSEKDIVTRWIVFCINEKRIVIPAQAGIHPKKISLEDGSLARGKDIKIFLLIQLLYEYSAP